MHTERRLDLEVAIYREVRAWLQKTDPKVYVFFLPLLDSDAFQVKLRPSEDSYNPRSIEDLDEILKEMTYLLEQPEFNRSDPQRHIFVGVLIADLCGRSAWTHSAKIQKDFLKHKLQTNIAMHVQYIRDHLEACHYRHHGTKRRITIPPHDPSEKRGYAPVYEIVNEDLLEAPSAGVPGEVVQTAVFKLVNYNEHIVGAYRRGVRVRVFSRTGDYLLQDPACWRVISRCDIAAPPLIVCLLDPLAANPEIKTCVNETLARLQKQIRDADCQNRVRIVFHRGVEDNLEITQIGPRCLLVASFPAGWSGFQEIRPSFPLFEYFMGKLPVLADRDPDSIASAML